MGKVLILYGTRYGTNKEISTEIQKKIQEVGLTTEIYNLEEHKLKEIPPLQDYNGILIGTSIKMGRWTKGVKKFVQKRKSELIKSQNKLGFYVCCGEAAKKTDISNAINTFSRSDPTCMPIFPALELSDSAS